LKKIKPILPLLLIAIVTLLTLPQLPIPLVDVGDYPVFKKIDSSKNDKKIVFVSDTQEPIWIETFLLDRNNNENARDLIFEEIIKNRPNKVIHLGDIVAFGYKDDSWKPIDNYLKKFLENDIQFYPTLGNHELLLFSDAGEKQFQKRFPFYSRTGYSINNGEIEIILLNSNFSEMTNKEIKQQQKWYKKRLKELEKDSTISVVIVGTHHSPFTNSKIVSPNEDVQKLFVTPFLKSKKGKLFISGHCHAFEHFKHEGKDFLVIGGGGGLQQPLYIGEEARWKDEYSSKNSIRMFHYLNCEVATDTLYLTLNILKKDFSKFDTNYKIKVSLK
jgi:hypothetical protein